MEQFDAHSLAATETLARVATDHELSGTEKRAESSEKRSQAPEPKEEECRLRQGQGAV